MDNSGWDEQQKGPPLAERLESPFLQSELFADETEPKWEARLVTVESESPFLHALEQGQVSYFEPEAGWVEAAEADAEQTLADLEDTLEEASDEAEYMEEETDAGQPIARMKFEFQTHNRIWRNDGATASRLKRKYGPDDFIVNQKKEGVRLESENDENGFVEFETEWFRTWPKLERAIKKAVEMTEDMGKAGPSKFDATRKAFPFNVDHLRRGTTKEMAQGFWNPRKDKENDRQKILGAQEELEVELLDHDWQARIQSSEGFMLEYYESFLRQHAGDSWSDTTTKHAKAILDAVNTDHTPAEKLVKLYSFLQIIVNYIRDGIRWDVKGKPAKSSFTLMSRTNFASIYSRLLTEKEKKLFLKIVKTDVILKEMGLDHSNPIIKSGYGTDQHQKGPTVHDWLRKIPNGRDLLSGEQTGDGLSKAMGRYEVETRSGEKDRWQVKFETRSTIMQMDRQATEWLSYAREQFNLASNRERDVLKLAHKAGMRSENKLSNLIFHARHPELKYRRIRRGEESLAQEWRQIREDLVRASFPGIQPELETFEELDLEFETDEFEDHECSCAHARSSALNSHETLDEAAIYEASPFDVAESEEFEGVELDEEPRPHPTLLNIREIDLRHRRSESPSQFESDVWEEQFDPAAPAKLVQLDHWHVPLTPDPVTGGFTARAASVLVKADMNPGFVDAGDALITDTSANGLQTCLGKLVQTAGKRLLAGNSKPSADDRIRVAVVDLTGRKLAQPEFAGWGSTLAMYGASVPKILGLYAAFQVRSDVRQIASQGGITNGAALEKEAKAIWKSRKLPQFPDLVWLFDIRKWDGSSGPIDFTSTAIATFKDIMHNCPAGTIIAKASLPFIGSLVWQSGLYHPQRGGLWLKAAYCGKGSWSSPVRAPSSHNVTALSAATFFTLLAQGRLVDAASSADMKSILVGGCVTGVLPSAVPVIASKCGLWKEYLHDAVLVDDGTVRYAAAVLSRLRTNADVTAYQKVWVELDALVRRNNQSPKPAC